MLKANNSSKKRATDYKVVVITTGEIMIRITNTKWYDKSDNAVKKYSEENLVKDIAEFFKSKQIVADIKVVTTKVVMRQYVRAIRVKNKPNRMVSFKGKA